MIREYIAVNEKRGWFSGFIDKISDVLTRTFSKQNPDDKTGRCLDDKNPNCDDLMLGPYRSPAWAPDHKAEQHAFLEAQKAEATKKREAENEEAKRIQELESDLDDAVKSGWFSNAKSGAKKLGRELSKNELKTLYASLLEIDVHLFHLDDAIEVARLLGLTVPQEHAERCLQYMIQGGWYSLAKRDALFLDRGLTRNELQTVFQVMMEDENRSLNYKEAVELTKLLGRENPRWYGEISLCRHIYDGWLTLAREDAELLGRPLTQKEIDTAIAAEKRRRAEK